ncbi:hypothetical protein B7L74_11085 (plasmid) [Coxiella burnetii]|nr:hypothetical protein B7L74_11085 [Coxiella burnetii]
MQDVLFGDFIEILILKSYILFFLQTTFKFFIRITSGFIKLEVLFRASFIFFNRELSLQTGLVNFSQYRFQLLWIIRQRTNRLGKGCWCDIFGLKKLRGKRFNFLFEPFNFLFESKKFVQSTLGDFLKDSCTRFGHALTLIPGLWVFFSRGLNHRFKSFFGVRAHLELETNQSFVGLRTPVFFLGIGFVARRN